MCSPAVQFWCSSELPVGPVWWTSCSLFPQHVGLQACVYVDHHSARSTCASVTKENCLSRAFLNQGWKIMHFQCRRKWKNREWMEEKKSTQNCDLDCKWDSTSRLTKKINKSSVQQPVWVQVILILQSKWVRVCVLEKNKWPHRWRGQAFQHLPETEHTAFPFSIIQSFGPPDSLPVPLYNPPLSYQLLSDVF